MASSTLANMKRTTQAMVDGYNKVDLDAILAVRSNDCLYHTLPESMGVPPRTNQEWREFFSNVVTSILSNFHFEPTTTVYDAEARKSVIHGVTTGATPFGPYNMELIIILEFNEAGQKVTKMQEYFDSAYMQQLMAKIGELQAQGGQGQ